MDIFPKIFAAGQEDADQLLWLRARYNKKSIGALAQIYNSCIDILRPVIEEDADNDVFKRNGRYMSDSTVQAFLQWLVATNQVIDYINDDTRRIADRLYSEWQRAGEPEFGLVLGYVNEDGDLPDYLEDELSGR